MRYRSNIYEFSQAARIVLAVLLMFCPVSIFASSVNTIDTVSKAKSLGDVVNRVISETESSIDLGTGTTFGDDCYIRSFPSVSYQVPVSISCPNKETEMKLDVGEYTYDTQRPHAVVSVDNSMEEIPDDTQSVTRSPEFVIQV